MGNVQFTVSVDTYEKLKRAQDLPRHSVPIGDPAIIFERAVTLLVAELERRKTNRPQVVLRVNRHPRRIPAAFKRTVWQRDGGHLKSS